MIHIKNRHMMIVASLGLGLALLLGLMGLLDVRPVSASAANWTVTNTNDSGAGSLRAAIASAADGDTIDFASALNGQTIILTSGELVISKNLTIDGPGAELLAVSGNNSGRVFEITSTVTISGVTVRDANTPTGSGAGIRNDGGTLTIVNSTVAYNTAVLSGGGIWSDGTLTIVNSTIDGNAARLGGGIFNGGALTVTNSAVDRNTAVLDGGGILNLDTGMLSLTDSTFVGNTARFSGGGVWSDGTLTIVNNTFAGNLAILNGGGIFNGVGTLSLTNSTVAGNTARLSGGGLFLDDEGKIGMGTTMAVNSIVGDNHAFTGSANDCKLVSGTLTSGGYNLVQNPDASCVFAASGDITGLRPMLAPLADNGGDTLTRALLSGSPAIDRIPDGVNGCGTTFTADQRGVNRPLDGDGDGIAGCDIGAYEAMLKFYLPIVLK